MNKLSKPIAPDDIKRGQHLVVLRGRAQRPAGPLIYGDGTVLRVLGISLPYVAVDVAGTTCVVDARSTELAVATRGYVRAMRSIKTITLAKLADAYRETLAKNSEDMDIDDIDEGDE